MSHHTKQQCRYIGILCLEAKQAKQQLKANTARGVSDVTVVAGTALPNADETGWQGVTCLSITESTVPRFLDLHALEWQGAAPTSGL